MSYLWFETNKQNLVIKVLYEEIKKLGVQVAPRAASGAGGQTIVVPGTVKQPQDAAVNSSKQVNFIFVVKIELKWKYHKCICLGFLV